VRYAARGAQSAAAALRQFQRLVARRLQLHTRIVAPTGGETPAASAPAQR